MKILHTSDWHLGQVFYEYDRSAEQEDMLRQIKTIIEQEKPDAMVISGDIFHTGSPSTKAVTMYNRAILEMHNICPQMQIVVTAGNHDSASRLTVSNNLWDCFNVKIIGNVARKEDEDRSPDYDSNIITVQSADKATIGYIAAVPHCYESNFPSEDPELQREERAKAYFKGLSERVKQLNPQGLPVVLMAHLAVSGSDLSGHENVGGMETRDASLFGQGYDYVALGHIHTPQNITERIRYCGTPIPVNFGEKFQHSVSIVTIETGKEPLIETREIKNLIPLHDFPTQLPPSNAREEDLKENERPLPFKDVLEKLKTFPDEKVCYLRLIVKVDESMSPLADILAREAIRGKKCRICRIQTFRYRKEANSSAVEAVKINSKDLQDRTPLEIAQMYFAMKGLELSKAQEEMIKEATREAEANSKN